MFALWFRLRGRHRASFRRVGSRHRRVGHVASGAQYCITPCINYPLNIMNEFGEAPWSRAWVPNLWYMYHWWDISHCQVVQICIGGTFLKEIFASGTYRKKVGSRGYGV